MITINDCILLLTDLQEMGTTDVDKYIHMQVNSNKIEKEVIDFINKNRPLDIALFYENLRRNYNQKKSKLYKEIVQVDEKEPKDVIVTLSSLLNQIFIYSKKIEEKEMFLRHARAKEIAKCLAHYIDTGDYILCIEFLILLRADLKALEFKNNSISRITNI